MTEEIKSALDNSGTDEMVMKHNKGQTRRHKRAANSIALLQWPISNASRTIPYIIESSSGKLFDCFPFVCLFLLHIPFIFW